MVLNLGTVLSSHFLLLPPSPSLPPRLDLLPGNEPGRHHRRSVVLPAWLSFDFAALAVVDDKTAAAAAAADVDKVAAAVGAITAFVEAVEVAVVGAAAVA